MLFDDGTLPSNIQIQELDIHRHNKVAWSLWKEQCYAHKDNCDPRCLQWWREQMGEAQWDISACCSVDSISSHGFATARSQSVQGWSQFACASCSVYMLASLYFGGASMGHLQWQWWSCRYFKGKIVCGGTVVDKTKNLHCNWFGAHVVLQ